MRSITNRGHAPVESISAPAGVDVLSSVLRKESILGSIMSSNSSTTIELRSMVIQLRSTPNRAQIDLTQAPIDSQSVKKWQMSLAPQSGMLNTSHE
ncbi:hypothetical protein PSTG_05709 [Puccinia striiformis f. sp. tritici PST-78]|uniref:Uncharacterized protein n=1 Tax=Puccinia striiformis f. sp. tritici PST-78 TaxID=1165861 RepID=A0A0L0VP77_9BASI|nr:hypothetical protein PSTG_05709 [Puccinia striiformis f. sp. tritici PST-78]